MPDGDHCFQRPRGGVREDQHAGHRCVGFISRGRPETCGFPLDLGPDEVARPILYSLGSAAASCDTPEVHLAWVKTPRKRGGLGHMQIPSAPPPFARSAALWPFLLGSLSQSSSVRCQMHQEKQPPLPLPVLLIGGSKDQLVRPSIQCSPPLPPANPPVLSDQTKSISADYGVLIKAAGIPLRGLFIIDPDGNLQQARAGRHCVLRGIGVLPSRRR